MEYSCTTSGKFNFVGGDVRFVQLSRCTNKSMNWFSILLHKKMKKRGQTILEKGLNIVHKIAGPS